MTTSLLPSLLDGVELSTDVDLDDERRAEVDERPLLLTGVLFADLVVTMTSPLFAKTMMLGSEAGCLNADKLQAANDMRMGAIEIDLPGGCAAARQISDHSVWSPFRRQQASRGLSLPLVEGAVAASTR